MNFIVVTVILTLYVTFGSTFSHVTNTSNNACRKYRGYLSIDWSDECFNIPDFGDNVTEIINRHTGPGVSETHQVTTEDGYIITSFRLTVPNPRGVVILQHPLSCDARLWLGQGNQSTALLFYNQGYDVWLPNNRGTLFSQQHVTLTAKEPAYWNFTFHEMGLYDHKAVFDYIRETTGQKAIFIGHSMAGTSSLIYAALRPQEAVQNIKVMVQLSPIAIMTHTSFPAKVFAGAIYASKPIMKTIHSWSFLKYDSWYLKFGRKLAIDFIKLKKILIYLIDIFVGWVPNNYDPQYFDMMVEQFGGQVSWKTIYHYAQIMEHRGRFQLFDYGSKNNLKWYGSKNPPEYPLGNITVPNYIVYSTDDSVSRAQDDLKLFSELSDEAKIYGTLKISGVNHLDYHYGKNRIANIYQPVINFLQNIT